MSVRIGLASLALGVLVAAAAMTWPRPAPPLFGFTRESAAAQARLERRFLDVPSADRIREMHRHLTGRPHRAGSPRNRELAEWTHDKFATFGLEEVRITSHEVLLPLPVEVSVEMTAPRAWRASMREDPIPEDPDTHISPEEAGLPYHAYSASGEVTAPVVYAGSGDPADYDRLASQGIEVRGRIVLVRYSVPYSYRGFKALTAEQRGAAGILIYSDPAEDGFVKGVVYPEGPWAPESRIHRGSIAYDFLVPGDPLTPGWASLPGAARISASEATSLPKIVSAPLSAKDARVILESLDGPEAPKEWWGALPITYRLGGGNTTVRVRVTLDDTIRPVWTVTGMIHGSKRPDEVVIVGNHRDAWVYGGVDPSSGSAALMELALALGELNRDGWKPTRSILFASWDAEEFALISSTEWGEQHASWLGRTAVAYLNLDAAVSGPDFRALAVPALNRVIAEAAQMIRDPALRIPVAAAARDRRARERGVQPRGTTDEVIDNRLGGGSDYAVFLNFIGVPVADLSFEGPYGIYHSLYDNHHWVSTIGDPGFRYHVALVQLLGLITLRLAGADVIPLDYEPYAERIGEFAEEVARRWSGWPHGPDLDEILLAAAEMKRAAGDFNRRRDDALSRSDREAMALLNARLIETERAFIDPAGIPGRPWYRHLVYAPKFSYAPEVLPGLGEAVDAGDAPGARREARRLAEAIRRATDLLR